jgi:hypothetical protein
VREWVRFMVKGFVEDGGDDGSWRGRFILRGRGGKRLTVDGDGG